MRDISTKRLSCSWYKMKTRMGLDMAIQSLAMLCLEMIKMHFVLNHHVVICFKKLLITVMILWYLPLQVIGHMYLQISIWIMRTRFQWMNKYEAKDRNKCVKYRILLQKLSQGYQLQIYEWRIVIVWRV